MTTVIILFTIFNYLISLIIGLNEGKIEGSFTYFGVPKNEETKVYFLLAVLLPVSLIFIMAFKISPNEISLLSKILSGITHGIATLIVAVLYITPLYALSFISAVITGMFLRELSKINCSKSSLLSFLFVAVLSNYMIYKAINQFLVERPLPIDYSMVVQELSFRVI